MSDFISRYSTSLLAWDRILSFTMTTQVIAITIDRCKTITIQINWIDRCIAIIAIRTGFNSFDYLRITISISI